ncbi:MAG: ATP-binding protein [Acidobacteriota bacterium]
MDLAFTSAVIYTAQGLGALLVAVVCHLSRRRSPRPFLADWSIAWAGEATFVLVGVAIVQLPDVFAGVTPIRTGASAVTLAAKYVQVIWLVLGVRLLLGRPTRIRQHIQWLPVVVGVLALLTVLLTNPLPFAMRYLLRVSLAQVVSTVAYGWAAAALYRSATVPSGLGRTIVIGALALYALSEAQYATTGIIRMMNPGWLGDPIWLGLLGFFVHAGMAVGVIALLLESEVERRAESVRHERQALSALTESEARQRLVLDNVGELVYELRMDESDRRPRLVFLAGRVEDILGIPRATAIADPEALARIVHPDDVAGARAALASAVAAPGGTTRLLRIVRPDTGATRWIEDRIFRRDDPTGAVRLFGVARDVTERHEAEAALRDSQRALEHAQRLDALGRLAGGVAHEFNNLLTAITGYGAIIAERLAPSDALHREVRALQVAASRAADLTRQLLAFGRRQERRVEVLRPAEVAARTEAMLRGLVGEAVRLELALDEDAPRVKADRGQLEHVLVNLALNAREAMTEGGTLTVRTRASAPADAAAIGRLGLPPGRYAVIEVTDTGIGMTDVVQAHIFEPFFTTKSREHSTGMGLAMVYGIVQQSHGAIGVRSAPGEGATFSIYLPETSEPETAAPPAAAASPNGTVLVVEDDAGVRELVHDVLVRTGFRVLEAHDGTSALEQLEAHRGSIRLVLTDVVMPGISGYELARRVKAERPELAVLFMTGYAEPGPFDLDTLAAGPVLQKPFSPRMLAEAVRAALR